MNLARRQFACMKISRDSWLSIPREYSHAGKSCINRTHKKILYTKIYSYTVLELHVVRHITEKKSYVSFQKKKIDFFCSSGPVPQIIKGQTFVIIFDREAGEIIRLVASVCPFVCALLSETS